MIPVAVSGVEGFGVVVGVGLTVSIGLRLVGAVLYGFGMVEPVGDEREAVSGEECNDLLLELGFGCVGV